MNSFQRLEDSLNKGVTVFSSYISGIDPRVILVVILCFICAVCVLKILRASFGLFIWSIILVLVSQPIPWLLVQIQKLPISHK